MLINQYPVYDNVSQEIIDLSKKIYDILGQQSLYGYYYTGYPIFERNNDKKIVPIMFVSKYGLTVFFHNDDDKEEIDSFIMKQMTESRELKELYKKKSDELVSFIKISEFTDSSLQFHDLNEILTDEQVAEVNSYLQSSYSMNKKDKRVITKKESIGNVIKDLNTQIATLDQVQFNTIYKTVDKHMRIRGLAGSGKTILLVRKMAYLHFKFPNLKMAYVFYTVSLKEHIMNLFSKFYRDFSMNSEPNLDNIKIIHGWGSKKREGFYSHIAELLNEEPNTYGELFGYADRLDEACKRLAKKLEDNKLEIFDYVFIDEAQDFGVNFFRLAVKSLTSSGKLFYAYDELQTLDSNKSIPTIQDIFETDDESICETINLDKSYRCPNNLLVTAHALGLGIYHKDNEGNNKIINMIEDLSVWKGVGYHEVSGTLQFGHNVTLARTEDQKLKDILEGTDVVISNSLSTNDEQFYHLASEINRLLSEEDVLPEDILIIDLDSINLKLNYISFRKKLLELQEADSIIKIDVNLVNKDSGEIFTQKNEVTYTTVFRAKGNESNIVFIINAGQKDNVYLSYSRNRLFTAMTRSKVRTYVFGIENNQIVEEIEEVKRNNYNLIFKYPSSAEMKKINRLSKKETDKANKYNKVLKELQELIKDKDTADELKQDLSKLLDLTEE